MDVMQKVGRLQLLAEMAGQLLKEVWVELAVVAAEMVLPAQAAQAEPAVQLMPEASAELMHMLRRSSKIIHIQ
jgi:hypothetical protein